MKTFSVSISLLMIAGLLLLSGGSNPLNAQPSLGVSPATLSYTLATGSSQTQVIMVNVAPNGPFTVVIQPGQQQYLSANPASGTTTPAQVSVTVNATGLAPNDYTMSLTVVSGTQQQSVFISVKVTGSLSQIAANPASLAFSYQTGGAVPDIRDVIISSLTGSAQNFTVSVSSGWLEATPVSGNTASTNVVRVKATPGTLAAGAYDGTVSVTPVGGNPLQIPVRLTISGAPQVSLNKTALSFVWQTGTPPPVAQTISTTAINTDSQIFFNVEATTETTPQWLVSPTAYGITPADIQVNVSSLILHQLAAGKYKGTVRITAQTSVNPVQLVPVTLTISATPLLVLAPSSMQFNMAASGSVPATQKVTVASTSTALAYTATFVPASGGNWLTLSPLLGTSPSEIQATVNAAAQSLLPGTYTGAINVISGTDLQSVPVTLTVSNSAVLSSSPGSLTTFVYQTGKTAPADQAFTVSSTGGPISFTAAVASTGNWLSLSSVAAGAVLSTPSDIGVRVNVAGLAAGTYVGTVTLTPVGGTSGATTVNVRLQVSNSALLRIGSNELTFMVQPGGPQGSSQYLAVDSTGDPLTFNVTTDINYGNWLGIFSGTNGTTPSNVNVSVNATGLTPGTYTGSVTITPIGGGPAQSVPVKLVVSAGSLAVSPSALTFTQFAGMAAPAAQTVNVTNPAGGALPFSVVSDSAWLTVTPSSGSAPAALAVVADGRNLLPGTYTGTITVQAPGASNSPQLIRATLTVMQQQTITIGVSSLSFSAQSPTQPPAAQPITVQGSTSGMTVKATATTVTGGNWLVVAPVEGAIPVTLNVSIAPAVLAGLAAGTYTGSIRIESPNTSNSPQTVGVTLTVAAALPSLLGVVNSASYLPGQLAPGEIVYVTGTNMGPAQLTIASPNPSFPTALAEVRVLFDGIAAPLLYVMNDKASAIVPWALAGRASTQVQIEYKGQKSTALNLQMGAVAPGIYSTAASGSGQGAILNQDYSYNGTAANTKRAAKGSVIMVYGTGGGVTTPAGIDGAITPGILYPLNVPATASLGGRTARVTYAGGAPGLVSGALQMNVEIPDDAPSGAAVPLVILIGGTPTQANLTVAIE